MKLFHISDVLSVATGRLLSNRGVKGIYDILNFLTEDDLFTHQLPRALRECEPWLRSQFPKLVPDDPGMKQALENLDGGVGKDKEREEVARIVEGWVEGIRVATGYPEMVPVYELPGGIHLQIDPIEEARAMKGDDKVIVIEAGEGNR